MAPPYHIAFTDLDGVLRGKRVSAEKYARALEAPLGFCDVAFGWDVADEPYDHVESAAGGAGYPDAALTVDPRTERRLPWADDEAFALGDFSEGALADACPRTLLRRVLAKAERMGYRVVAGLEYEWCCFAETPQSLEARGGQPPRPATPGMHGYSMLRPGSLADFNRALWAQLAAFDVPLEGLHTETGPGVYEAAIAPADALTAADRAACFKYATKQIALRHGLVASFMAKWHDGLPGNGGHVHQSLVALGGDEAGENVFARERSLTRDRYLAGQLRYLPLLLPLLAPTANSYKRLVPGSWAPTSMTYGADNRTVALRVLGDRLENRIPGADANPYLALAASVAAGLAGLAEELPLRQAPTTGDAYAAAPRRPLARSLAEATALLRAERTAAAGLLGGEGFVDHFLRTRDWEVRQAQRAVTDWERRRYLEII